MKKYIQKNWCSFVGLKKIKCNFFRVWAPLWNGLKNQCLRVSRKKVIKLGSFYFSPITNDQWVKVISEICIPRLFLQLLFQTKLKIPNTYAKPLNWLLWLFLSLMIFANNLPRVHKSTIYNFWIVEERAHKNWDKFYIGN